MLFRNIYNTFYDLQYHYCLGTILHGSHSYETKSMRWTHGKHTRSHENSTTFFSDSKLKMKKQGSFFITLIDCIFKRHLIAISHQTSKLIQRPQTQQHSLQYQFRTQKMKDKLGTFVSPEQIFIMLGLSDCAANKSFVFKPFWINSSVMNSGWTSITPSIPLFVIWKFV